MEQLFFKFDQIKLLSPALRAHIQNILIRKVVKKGDIILEKGQIAKFIYFIEENPTFLPLILPLFREADQDKRDLVTSALTLLEALPVRLLVDDEPLGSYPAAPITCCFRWTCQCANSNCLTKGFTPPVRECLV